MTMYKAVVGKGQWKNGRKGSLERQALEKVLRELGKWEETFANAQDGRGMTKK